MNRCAKRQLRATRSQRFRSGIKLQILAASLVVLGHDAGFWVSGHSGGGFTTCVYCESRDEMFEQAREHRRGVLADGVGTVRHNRAVRVRLVCGKALIGFVTKD